MQVDYKDNDVSAWKEACKCVGLLCLFGILIGLCILLCGCSSLQPAPKYLPGQLYGNGGATACTDAMGNPIVCKVDGGVPWCPYPNDGDGF